MLWTDPAIELPVRAMHGASGVVLGDVSPMPSADEGLSPLRPGAADARDSRDAAVRLSRTYWGHYVALISDPASGAIGVYRDPSGAIDCMLWSLGEGLSVVASDMVRLSGWLRPRRQRINWDRIAGLLAVPYANTSSPLFDDVTVVNPGDMVTLGERLAPAASIWSPADFACPEAHDLPEVQAEIVRRVDACTEAIVGRYDKVIVELSGGLDSSILAGSLAATGAAARVAAWLNYRGDRSEGDESRYARTVTDRIGVELTTVRKDPTPLDADNLAELAMEFWPGMGGVDVSRDRHELALVRAIGAQAIVSGQGGDGVFFQFPSALVAADEFRRKGCAAFGSPVLADVARRTRQSVWGVLGQVRAVRNGTERRPFVSSTILSPHVRAGAGAAAHPWVEDARRKGLPPGKTLHVQGIATTHLYNGRSRRRRDADLVYPLFAQPVMELCLTIPTPDLAGGSYDRPFARQTFAQRLPASVLARRAKGNLTTYFARLVASSADSLRPYLLDGCLSEAGLLDRDELERLLDPRHLICGGMPTDVLWAAVIEAWVRYWQARVPDSETAPRRFH
jgi:asparagine synthase (glutamine-hydrolysing)